MENVLEAAKRVCDFINTHDDLIKITTLGEYRVVMLKVMRVISEAHNVDIKRRQVYGKKKSEENMARTQRAKSLIADVKNGEMKSEEILRRLEKIIGRGSSKEIVEADTSEKIVERIQELSKREEQFDEWETMRKEAKKKTTGRRKAQHLLEKKQELPRPMWRRRRNA